MFRCESRATTSIQGVKVCTECAIELSRAVAEVAAEQDVSASAIATLRRFQAPQVNLEEVGRRDLSHMAIDAIKRASVPAMFVVAAIVQQVVCQ